MVIPTRPNALPLEPPADTVERLRAGDPEAFAAMYELYRARLYSFLLRLSRDEQLARDLAQETWLRFAANARRLEPGSAPAAWLFRVARNLYISQRRWSAVHEAGLAALRFMFPARTEPTPLERVATSALEQQLERALADLPIRYREVILLVAVEGFDAATAATMLGISHASARQRLTRARAMIKRALVEIPTPEQEP